MNDKFTVRLIINIIVILFVLSAWAISAACWLPMSEFMILWGSVGVSSILAIVISERMLKDK